MSPSSVSSRGHFPYDLVPVHHIRWGSHDLDFICYHFPRSGELTIPQIYSYLSKSAYPIRQSFWNLIRPRLTHLLTILWIQEQKRLIFLITIFCCCWIIMSNRDKQKFMLIVIIVSDERQSRVPVPRPGTRQSCWRLTTKQSQDDEHDELIRNSNLYSRIPHASRLLVALSLVVIAYLPECFDCFA